jgi:hypothetical protein
MALGGRNPRHSNLRPADGVYIGKSDLLALQNAEIYVATGSQHLLLSLLTDRPWRSEQLVTDANTFVFLRVVLEEGGG